VLRGATDEAKVKAAGLIGKGSGSEESSSDDDDEELQPQVVVNQERRGHGG